MKDEDINTFLLLCTLPPSIFISYMIGFYTIEVYNIYLLLGDINPHGFIIVMGHLN